MQLSTTLVNNERYRHANVPVSERSNRQKKRKVDQGKDLSVDIPLCFRIINI